MRALNRETAGVHQPYPERVLQFGGGNFLRGFVDWMLQRYNAAQNAELGVLVIKPTPGGDYSEWREQEGLYHVLTKGLRDGQQVNEHELVTCVSRIIHPYHDFEAFLTSAEQPDLRYVISNTTESGLRVSDKDKATDEPPVEFPAKLTLWLHHRFHTFKGSAESGCVFIPTELVEDNGALLRKCILENATHWRLGNAFARWIEEHNIFCNTLVDRIIPGISSREQEGVWQTLGFKDLMATQGEPYHLWAIEAPKEVRKELPLDQIGLNIVYTDDLTPFRQQKVRILNGTHTIMVPVALLYGVKTVREALEDAVTGPYIREVMFEEILPTLDYPEKELNKFATDVLDRFGNPFIEHRLISIALNAIPKFRTRVIPTLLEYVNRKEALPKRITLSLAAWIRFYKGSWQDESLPLKDEAWVIEYFAGLWKNCNRKPESVQILVTEALQNAHAWGADLTEIPGLTDAVSAAISEIEEGNIAELIKQSNA